jgi:hypothetical protein
MNNQVTERPEYFVDNYDLCKIKFVSQRNSYRVFISSGYVNELVKFNAPKMNVPFGPEKYNFKEIINLEFTDKDSDNEMYNFFSQIASIDTFFAKLGQDPELQKVVKLPYNVREAVAGRTYQSCIRLRPGKFDPLLRVHLKRKGNVVETDVIEEEDYKSIYQTKGKSYNAQIYIGSLWFSKDSYGVNWILEHLVS